MSKGTLKGIIKSLVLEELTLLEKLRGTFNWAQFKALASDDVVESLYEMEEYCQRTLGRPVGKGSSRIVFALSSNKVLKLAQPNAHEKGLAQNELEVETFTNPKMRPVLAAIYEYDPKYLWVVAEITRPFQETMKIEQALGLNMSSLEELLKGTIGDVRIKSFDEGWEDIVGKAHKVIEATKKEGQALNKKLEELEKMEMSDYERRMKEIDIFNQQKELGWNQRRAEETIEKFSSANVSRLKPLIDGILAMRDQMHLNIDDLLRMDHYGLTADGRIVVIDYGYNYEIGRKYYGFR